VPAITGELVAPPSGGTPSKKTVSHLWFVSVLQPASSVRKQIRMQYPPAHCPGGREFDLDDGGFIQAPRRFEITALRDFLKIHKR
jgi:hypothetical protein